MNNGVLTMTAELYHSANGVSKSMLDYLAPPDYTPSHYRARFITRELEKEETPAMRLGSLVHRCILEPDSVAGAFHIKPEDMSFTTKEGRAWRAEHGDRPIVSANEAKTIKGARDAVYRHPIAKRFMAGEKERSLFAQDSHGTLRKGRLDILCPGNIVPDLKTCASTAERDLQSAITDHRYHVQLAYYCDLCKLVGIEKEVGVLIFVEKAPPYDVVCKQIRPEVMDAGRAEYRANLALLRHCEEANDWPGRSVTLDEIDLSPWAMKQLEAV